MPFIVAYVFAKADRVKMFLVMMATMLVDIDHLLATPVYDPNRCSIGFHPLHEPILFVIYVLLAVFGKAIYRWIGVGLLIHMALDSIDCKVNLGVWFV